MPDPTKSLLADLYKSKAHCSLMLTSIEKAIKNLEKDVPVKRKKGYEDEVAAAVARRRNFLSKQSK